MLATSLSQDLYRGFVRPGATDREVLAVARLAAVAGGALGVGIAIVSPTVIGALAVFYSLLSVSLFVPVAVGVLDRRTGRAEVLAAIAGGVSVLVAAQVWSGGAGIGPWSPVLLGLVAALAAWAAVRWLRRSEGAMR
jgi:SSS family solute:Na+ symporter